VEKLEVEQVEVQEVMMGVLEEMMGVLEEMMGGDMMILNDELNQAVGEERMAA
jgi:hypothetical protein